MPCLRPTAALLLVGLFLTVGLTGTVLAEPHDLEDRRPPPGILHQLQLASGDGPADEGTAWTATADRASHMLPPGPDAMAEAGLLSFPALLDDPERARLAFLAQLERSGSIPSGVTAFLAPALDPQRDAQAAAGPDAFPPTQVYFDARQICDIDGDGLEDQVVQRLAPHNGVDLSPSDASVTVYSGANRSIIWERDNAIYMIPAAAGLHWRAAGEPAWQRPDNVVPLPDLDQDGVCDLILFGFDALTFLSVPLIFFSGPRISETYLHLDAVSGASGESIWHETITANMTMVGEPVFQTASVDRVTNLPTAFAVTEGAAGPHLLIKYTDISRQDVQDPLGFSRFVLGDPFWRRDLQVTERVELRSARDGSVHWIRDISDEGREGTTDLTWLSATADLTADGVPDVVLEQIRTTNPQNSMPRDPVTGESHTRYGRGLRLLTLDGHPEAGGATVWRQDIVPYAPITAQTGFEESFEALMWTHSVAIEDISGDGVPEVVARYLTHEEGLPASWRGAFRTHIVPLDGTDGGPLWSARVQGWAAVQVLDPHPETGLLAVGSLDLVTERASSGRNIEDRVRVQVLSVQDGEQRWAYDKPWPENNPVSYNLILEQLLHSMAPMDLDGDGVRDPLTPARGQRAGGTDQVLLASQEHDYAVLDARDGQPLSTFGTWGGQGLATVCGGERDEGILTIFSGHARRYDVTRIDLDDGKVLVRTALLNDPSPRAATTGIVLTGAKAQCDTRSDGTLFLALNLGRYSFTRGYEVVSIQAVLEQDGTAQWITPELIGAPRNQPFVEPFATLSGEPAVAFTDVGVWFPALVGLILGALATPFVRRVWKRRSAGGLKGAQAVLIVLLFAAGALAAPIVTAFPGPPDAPDGAEGPPGVGLDRSLFDPAPVPSPEAAPDPAAPRDPEVAFHKRMLGLRHAQGAGPTGVSEGSLADGVRGMERRFDEEKAFSYTFPVGDLDHDGVDDLLLDTYCIGVGCYYPVPNPLNDPAAYAQWFFFGSGICTGMHWLFAVSGATGDVIWDHPLDTPPGTRLAGCTFEYVIGAVPLPYGDHAILVYRFETEGVGFIYPSPVQRIDHAIYALSARSGEETWRWNETGVLATDLQFSTSVARSAELNPIIQELPDPSGNGTSPRLYLQGIGWDATFDTWTGWGTGFLGMGGFSAYDAFVPEQWLARIDPTVGTEEWRAVTFSADSLTSRHSMYPRLVALPGTWWWDSYYNIVPARYHGYYWDAFACCGDLTGDGVPDLVYDVVEWSPTPAYNQDGPYAFETRLVAFDGADGSRLYEVPMAEDLEVRATRAFAYYQDWQMESRTFMLGDVDGDGKGDFYTQEVVLGGEHTHDIVVRTGATGEPIWRHESIRSLAVLPIGDADGDGAPDLVRFGWFGHEAAQEMFGDRDLPKNTELTIYSGRDGTLIRRDETHSAPADLIHQFRTHRLNGIPDLDGDAVGDHITDDPVSLDDQTVVHHLTARSTADGRALWSAYVVGTFAHPARLPDVTGDQIDDIAIVSGDVNDLWFTAYDGADGTALWSRRFVSLPVTGYAEAVPQIRIDALDNETSGVPELLVTFHLRYVNAAYSSITYIFCFGCDDDVYSEQQRLYFQTKWFPQVMVLKGDDGSLRWESPPLTDAALQGVVEGPTPATQVFLHQLQEHDKGWTTRSAEAVRAQGPGIAAFAVGLIIGVLAAALVIGMRERDRDLPDIDL